LTAARAVGGTLMYAACACEAERISAQRIMGLARRSSRLELDAVKAQLQLKRTQIFSHRR
jgi:hypothetical protein